MPSQIRRVQNLEYTLIRKTVKNINLRVRTDGTVMVSAPKNVAAGEIDAFVQTKMEWIHRAKQQILQRQTQVQQNLLPDKEECLQRFLPICQQIEPLFAEVLQHQPVQIKVRSMTSRWGVCHVTKRTITLAQQLAVKPLPAIEYVILHEYCHFVYPNHQREFWTLVEQYMPDWKIWRRMLREG